MYRRDTCGGMENQDDTKITSHCKDVSLKYIPQSSHEASPNCDLNECHIGKLNGNLHESENDGSEDSNHSIKEVEKKRKHVEDTYDFKGFKKQHIENSVKYFERFSQFLSSSLFVNYETDRDTIQFISRNQVSYLTSREASEKISLLYPEIANGDAVLKTRLEDSSVHSTKSEYAQYLGLQPTVKFKCIKCSTSNFPTLTALNDHLENCNEKNYDLDNRPSSSVEVQSSGAGSTNFKITRRVYLCSACGVYFEIWKLFLHMRAAHRRYICLICLGLFSIAERLSNHLVVKHDIVAKTYETISNFFQDYAGQIYVMCCECEKMFTEKDNFVEHICEPLPNKDTKPIANTSSSSIACGKSTETLNNSIKSNSQKNNKSQKLTLKINTVPKQSSKLSNKLKNKILPSEHITGDTHLDSMNESWNLQDNGKSTSSSLEESNENSSEIKNSKDSDESRPFLISETKKVNGLDHDEDDTSKSDRENNENFLSNQDDDSSNLLNLNCNESESIEGKNSNIGDQEPRGSAKSVVPTEQEQLTNQSDEAAQIEPVVSEEHISDSSDRSNEVMSSPAPVESRRVPKVTLKIPPNVKVQAPVDSDSESDDSYKLTMEVDDNGSANEEVNETVLTNTDEVHDSTNPDKSHDKENVNFNNKSFDSYPMAGPDIPIIDLGLRPPLDKVSIQSLLKDFIRATCLTCVYCNYARKIAVNGKQLGLHMIAEHRFSATADSITAEELLPETFFARIRDCFSELQAMYFNLESYDNESLEDMVPYDRTYECFQCRFVTTVHKELYLHNRKMHQKTILLCIMCKSTFYNYSELLCHLCPGTYDDSDVRFRCCLCPTDGIPSAFRLMVHLRKQHHACDVCLEICNNQSKLSNHVWKHKLHHFCYRCGIAYRNKPDITKHLFWKHGTESVLCKKCLQKRWPHVYHFCIPPTSFLCEECNQMFSKAIALKVHKRLHTNTTPYECTEENCSDKFISKKLLEKHITAHREPPPTECINPPTLESEADVPESQNSTHLVINEENSKPKSPVNEEISNVTEAEPKVKPVVDVYDLPALNLSESDSSDSETETNSKPIVNKIEESNNIDDNSNFNDDLEDQKPAPVVDGIWDNFKNYQASVGKRENFSIDSVNISNETNTELTKSEKDLIEEDTDKIVREQLEELLDIISKEHDYCVIYSEPGSETNLKEETEEKEKSIEIKENTVEVEEKIVKEENEEKKEKANSESSSDSDSSSCTCGSNCSCSSSDSSGSSSSGSSSSSDSDSSSSESRKRNEERRQKRKERGKLKKKISEQSIIDVTEESPVVKTAPIEIHIYESDLYTDESDTDEDFYDESPHLQAKKLIEEKKNQLLMDVNGPSSFNGSFLETSRSTTPIIPEEPVKKKVKTKSKKRKKAQKNRSSPTKHEIMPLRLNLNFSNNPYFVNQSLSSTPKLKISTPPTSVTINIPKIATPVYNQNQISSPVVSHGTSVTTPLNSNAGSGSETDSTLRLSKRRRVPNRFYGYTSDEETPGGLVKPIEPPQLQWNKEDLPSPPRPSVVKTPPITYTTPQWYTTQLIQTPATVVASSSDSSDSEVDSDDGRLHISQPETLPRPPASFPHPGVLHPRPAENLYCYCQCPYDEVSEMIACDGKNCAIEWFHFECVGIMVPPKGKWFCPDCRKQTTRPEYFMS